MPDQEELNKKTVTRVGKRQKQPKNQSNKDKPKPTSWGSKAWKGIKVAFWVWNAAKRCWELLEGDPPDLNDSDLTESEESDQDSQ